MLRNHISTLNTFIAYIGKAAENRLGREFLNDFNVKSAEFVQHSCPDNRRTAADKVSHLRAWKKTVDKIALRDKRRPIADDSKFHVGLRVVFAKSGESPTSLVRRIGGSTSSVNRWLAGAFPSKRELQSLRRLEKEFGLPRGHFEGMLPSPESRQCVKPGRDNYCIRLSENVKDIYVIPISALSERFKNEWRKLLKYKTTEVPVGLRRSSRGRWRTLPVEKVGLGNERNVWIQPDKNFACATAAINLDRLRAFFGFLVKSPSSDTQRSGFGLPPGDELQTIASIVIPEFVGAYFDFMKARSGGIVHSGHDVAASFFRSLLNPIDGYLIQQPEFYERIQKYAKGRTWEELRSETYELCGKWKKASVGNKSRDPKSPILHLLRLDSPLMPLWQAIRDLDRSAAESAPGSVSQATLKRDALLLTIAIANPLRARTFTIAKYILDGDGGLATNLYQTQSGQWRLRFEKGDLKNDGGARDEAYDAPIPKMYNDRIADYLCEFRPVLIRLNPTSPWLFPSSRTSGKLGSIGSLIASIAKRYIPAVARLRAHAIRHIVASDFLAKNPGQYTVIAELLHDSLETVLRNYAHLKQENAFRAHEEHLQRSFAEY